jgi:predicted O-methyltransferase YrrM
VEKHLGIDHKFMSEKKNFLFKINKIYNYIFGEKFYKKLNFNWSEYPKRLEIIQNIITIRKYKKYLEIGCDKDQIFSNITIDFKIGVDPVQGGNVRKTSDDFFISNSDKFDIIFIDGLHEYDQVNKDIKNSLKALNDGGVILLHDCLPKSYFHQAIPRSRMSWNGDVWKNIVELRTNSEIDTYTCFADQGIGIIFNRPNRKKLIISVNNFKKLKFRDFYYNYKEYLNIINSEEIYKIF